MRYEVVLLLLTIFCNISLGSKSYSNYTLFRTLPQTEKQLEFLKKNLTTIIKVDYWKPPGRVNKSVDVLIDPEAKIFFRKNMNEKNFSYTTVIEDIQRAFDQQTPKSYIRRNIFDWRRYHNLIVIYNWYEDLEKNYPNEVKILHLGKTFEKRDILGVKVLIADKKSKKKDEMERSVVVIEGGIHAREWIAPAVATFFLDQLVKSRDKPETELGKIAKTYEFYFIPVLNPDGYEYNMKHDRMWIKNRKNGYGVDINRNFDAKFGTIGVSKIKTDETYCGPHAFSEEESQAVKKMTKGLENRLKYYLAFHAYGRNIIIPYEHLKEHANDYNDVYPILKQASVRMNLRSGKNYSVGTAFETVGYLTSGVSGSWAKKTYRIPFVASFELGDSGEYGFALPYHSILPICREGMDGVQSILTPKTSQPQTQSRHPSRHPSRHSLKGIIVRKPRSMSDWQRILIYIGVITLCICTGGIACCFFSWEV